MKQFTKRNTYPCDRDQYIGYDRAYYETKDDFNRVTFVTFANDRVKKEGEAISGKHPTQQQAWDCFDAALKNFLKDKPGVVLWRMIPSAEFDKGTSLPPEFPDQEPGWCVVSRLAVTEDLRFADINLLTAIDRWVVP